MELLDRYLHAVKYWLPKAQQADILAELAEDLQSQIEDRETGLGRKLDEGEIAAILKQRGHPMLVAARYLPQQPLIGPALLPFYRFVLKLGLLWVLVPMFLATLIMALLAGKHPIAVLLQFLGGAWYTAFFVIGVVTVVFAVLEHFRCSAKFLDKWDPRRLPRVPVPSATPASRCRAITEIVAAIVWSAIWLYVAWYRPEFDLSGVRIALAPIGRTLLWPVLLVLLAGVAKGWVALAWPSRTWLRAGIRLAADGAGLILIYVLFQAGSLVDLSSTTLPAAGIADAAKWTNYGVWIGLIVVVIAIVVDVLQEVRRMIRGKTGHPGASSGLAANTMP